MNLITKVEITPSIKKIKHQHNVLFIGSCFAENISEKLVDAKFNVCCNPFGVVYNPISLYNCFDLLDRKKTFSENDLFFENGVWKSFYHHSSFCNTDKNVTLQNINNEIEKSSQFLKTVDFVFITLGTSWVYVHKALDIVVSNCHKVPAINFNRKLLSVNEVFESLKNIVEIIKKNNNNTQIIFTISPIRHLKDGLHNNNISKAILFVALNKLKEIYQNIQYFPAYEILIDELRDYRFYADDLLHPTKKAIDYIGELFSNSYFEAETINLNKKILEIKNAMLHKPFFPESNEYSTFMKNTYANICILSQKYPFLNFDIEKDFFKMC